MNFNINSNSLSNRQQVTDSKGKANLSENIKRALVKAGLTEGSVFNGKIQDITGNNVKILLSGGDTLLATLENGTKFNIGENVNFMVKSNDGVKILLQSVGTAVENSLSQSLINSLEQLGLNMNDRNINMVKEMMAYGMPLDISSLNDMEKLVNLFPDSSVEDIVTLNSHGIPVTDENLSQLSAYQSYEHKMTENIDSLGKELILLSESKPELVKTIIEDIMKGLSGILAEESGASNGGADVSDNTLNNADINANAAVNIETGGFAAEENDIGVMNKAMQEITDKVNGNQSSILTQGNDNDKIANESNTQLSSEDGTVVVRHNNDIGDSNKQNIQLQENDSINKPNISRQSENTYSANPLESDRLQREIKEAVKELKSRWLLKADLLEGKTGEEIKNTVNEKLKTIYASAERMMEALKNNGMEKSDTYKAAENIKNNIQFMNDFNHLASYVQVPYKTLSGEANGELFVYSRNKNKTLKDGPITAFLHLDMEYLGATDVKVTMDISGRVSTKFTLADIVSQNVVEEHLHELKRRLEQQGYVVELTSEVAESEKTESPFEQIMKVDKPRNEVKRYGFDIRL